MIIRDCKPDPERLGVLAECMTGDPHQGEWPGQLLSAQTVAYSCGILARFQDKVVHAHDADELKRCRRLAAEAAQIMDGVLIGGSDEGDHTLDPFFIPADAGEPAAVQIDEKVFRSAMRGTVHPAAILTIEPFDKSSKWWKSVSTPHPDLPNDPGELERVAQWGRLLDWFRSQSELHTPVYIGFEEPKRGEFSAAVYPKMFLGLTPAGSLVGLVTCVVWT